MNETRAIDACRELLTHLNNVNFPFTELRPKPLTPEKCFMGDYDFLYDGTKKSDLVRDIVYFLKSKKASFFILRKDQQKLQVQIFDQETGQKIILEFWTASVISVSIGAFTYSTALTWHDFERFIYSTKDGYKIDPNVRALIYSTHLKARKKDLKKTEVVERLKYFKEHCLPEGPEYGQLNEILENLAHGKENLKDGNRKTLAILKEIGAYRPLKTFFYAIGIKARSIFPMVKSPRIMTLEGPDGTGKSTLLKKVIKNKDFHTKYYKFKDLYRKHNGIDKLIRKYYPDRSLKRNQIDERVAGVHFLSSAIVFFFLRIFNFRKLFILDRYFYDLLLRGIRYKNQKGHEVWWHKIGCLIAPRPHCFFILDVPYEIAKQRKNEISEGDWDLIFDNYMKCYFTKPSKYLAVCNTDTTLENSVSFFNFVKKAIQK